MNTSNSPLLNLRDSLPAAEAAGARAAASRSTANGESFNAVYDTERASQSEKKRNNSFNNNDLKESSSTERKSAKTVVENGDEAKSAGAISEREDSAAEPSEHKADLSEKELAALESRQDEALAAEIELNRKLDDARANRGEALPPGGKTLPESDAAKARQLLTHPHTVDAEALTTTEQSSGDTDNELAGSGQQDLSSRSLLRSDGRDLNSQAKMNTITQSGSDYFKMDDAMQADVEKISGDAMLEKLAALTPAAPRELAPTAVQTNSIAPLTLSAANLDALQGATQSASPTAAETVDATLNVRGTSTDWSQAIGDKIRWMRNANASTAELHLNPAELGSIEIKIVTEDQQARVHFVASSSLAQEMIEESLSKLKELLAEHGIALDQSDVSQREKQNEFARDDRNAPARDSATDSPFENEATLSTGTATLSRIGQVDRYV